MTWVNGMKRGAAMLAALWCITPLASLAAGPAAGTARVGEDQLAAARAAFYAGLEGDSAATDEAKRRFADLAREHPRDATLEAYRGSLQMLEAGRTWAFWRKHTLSVEGLGAMDSAVAADPNDLEARFVRALTTWHLPFFFHRKQQAEEDLSFLGPRAEQAARTGALPPPLAAAALDYWGQVLAAQDAPDRARGAYLAAVRVDKTSPGGADALKHLR